MVSGQKASACSSRAAEAACVRVRNTLCAPCFPGLAISQEERLLFQLGLVCKSVIPVTREAEAGE